MTAVVTAVSRSSSHSFSKHIESFIRLVPGRGVEGDVHMGAQVRHRYDARKQPSSPNLRQVHLIHQELFVELRDAGLVVNAGDLGENITTRAVDLLALPKGTRLRLGEQAVVMITGLRAPCKQMDRFRLGLVQAVLSRDQTGKRSSKAGVMAVVVDGGDVCLGDTISVELPAGNHEALRPV